MEGKIYHQKHGLSHSMGTHGLKIVKDAFTIHRLVVFEALITFFYQTQNSLRSPRKTFFFQSWYPCNDSLSIGNTLQIF